MVIRLVGIVIILLLLLVGYTTYQLSKDTTALVPVKEEKIGTKLDKFDFQRWHEFTDPNGKFKVLFPNLPQHATENMDDSESGGKRKYDMYVAEKGDGSIFMISVITFENPEATANKEKLMRAMVNDMMASNPSNELKGVTKTKYKENDALDFSYSNPETNVEAKSFVINNTLYMLTRVTSTKNYTPDEFIFFVNSFDLTDQTQNPEGR